MNSFLNKIVGWLRAGYPDGVPQTDYLPLLALLGRRLSSDEVKLVANEVMARGEADGTGSGTGADLDVDIAVIITGITDELPTPDDIERVRARLAAKGWPLDDPREEDLS